MSKTWLWKPVVRPRRLLLTSSILCLIYIVSFRAAPAAYYNVFQGKHPTLNIGNTAHEIQPNHHNAGGVSNLTSNLVVASTAGDDVSWISRLATPTNQILRYVSDSRTARFRPPVPKGREALMYFTYLHDFYDDLPDISIFVHADETPWHVEGTLLQNTSFALSQLDLAQVEKRGYFNLRVTWRAACPAWINTTKTHDDWEKQEEPYMREAWQANFPGVPVPEILAGPCCSQFAASRAAIRSRPREQYRRGMEWLIHTPWSDDIAGRVWEHMWPWLFKEEASDCAPERRSLCEMYGVCFVDEQELSDYKEMWEERERLKEDMSFFRAVWRLNKAREARKKMDEVNRRIEEKITQAWSRGQDTQVKADIIRSAS